MLFHPEEAGVWLWHRHIQAHVSDDTGMTGMLTAVYVEGWTRTA